jgi:hypothetical protein
MRNAFNMLDGGAKEENDYLLDPRINGKILMKVT